MNNNSNFSVSKWFFIMAILFIGCSSDEEVVKETEATLDGKYTGSWSSITPTATFAGVPVSAVLGLSGSSNLSGEFFVSSSFVSCCNGTNDGTISMELDGSVITSFSYNDTISGCSGFFTGTGVIRDDGALFINFTGNDCDGVHSDGLLLLRKQ